MSPFTGVCIFLTAAFFAVSIVLMRYQKKPKTNPDLDSSTCNAIALYDPNIRKRYIWSYICIGLTILFTILTLVTAFQSKKARMATAITTPALSPQSTLEITCSPETVQTTESYITTSPIGSSEQGVCLDEKPQYLKFLVIFISIAGVMVRHSTLMASPAQVESECVLLVQTTRKQLLHLRLH